MNELLTDYAGPLSLLAGYGFAVFVEAIFVKNLVDTLWECIAPGGSIDPQVRPHPWQAQALTFLEGFLYVAFLQLSLGYLIGLWLLLKVGGQWKRWLEEADPKISKPSGQTIFNIFLIGNGFTIIYAVVGFKLIGWIAAGRIRAMWVPIIVVLATVVFWNWLQQFRKAPLATTDRAAATSRA